MSPAMRINRSVWWMALIVVLIVLGWAWWDAGREPVHPMAETIAVPGAIR